MDLVLPKMSRQIESETKSVLLQETDLADDANSGVVMTTTNDPQQQPERQWSEFVSNGSEHRPKTTWRCDKCGAEYDFFTYGGPCAEDGCDGELHRRKLAPS